MKLIDMEKTALLRTLNKIEVISITIIYLYENIG